MWVPRFSAAAMLNAGAQVLHQSRQPPDLMEDGNPALVCEGVSCVCRVYSHHDGLQDRAVCSDPGVPCAVMLV